MITFALILFPASLVLAIRALMLKFVQERVLTLLKLTRLPEKKKDEVDLVNVIVMYECVCT